MASDALSLAAGAGKGLEDILTQMLVQEKLKLAQAGQAEEIRHNQASEGLTGRQIEESAATRRDATAQRLANQKLIDEDRDNTRTLTGFKMAPIGSDVSPEAHDRGLKAGVPEGNFYWSPGNMGMSTPQGEVGPTLSGFKWLGDEDQILRKEQIEKEKTGAITDGNFMLNGKPIVGVKKAGRVTYKGEDVTDRVTPYVPPERPDRVLIQSEGGYIPRAEAAKKLRAGGEVPLADTSTVRTRRDTAASVGSHFEDAQALIDEADKRGLLGPIQGRLFADFMAGKVGSTGNAADDELIGELRMALSLARSGTAMLHGRGGANVGIVQALEKKMDEGRMSPQELKGALKGMKDWVDTYAAKKTGGESSSSTSDGKKIIKYDLKGNIIP